MFRLFTTLIKAIFDHHLILDNVMAKDGLNERRKKTKHLFSYTR